MKQRGIGRPELRTRPSQTSLSAKQVERLIIRVQKGDIDAFQELYGFYARKILNYVYRMTGSKEEAEDLTQDTFVLAFRNIHSLQDNRKFQSWLFRIAQNNVYQKYRGKEPALESIDAVDEDEIPQSQKLPGTAASPEQRILSEELEKIIHEAIHALPDKYKQVFILSAIQKMSYQEIAETLDRSLAAVKSDIHRARVAVRNKIKKYLGDNYGMSGVF